MLDFKALTSLRIDAPDEESLKKVRKTWDSISKPIDGLGDFEKTVCRIAAIQRTDRPDISKRAAVIFCADNGLVEEGISQSGKEITLSVARALGSGISSACTLARSAGVTVMPVDVGIDTDESISGVRDMKVRRGTENFLKAPAMTEREALLAIEHGIELVKELSEDGVKIISTG